MTRLPIIFLAVVFSVLAQQAIGQDKAKDDDAKGKEEARYKGKPTSFWVKQLSDKDASFRLEAVKALKEIGPDEEGVVPALAKTLKDKDATVRDSALEALASMPLKGITSDLVESLKAADLQLRREKDQAKKLLADLESEKAKLVEESARLLQLRREKDQTKKLLADLEGGNAKLVEESARLKAQVKAQDKAIAEEKDRNKKVLADLEKQKEATTKTLEAYKKTFDDSTALYRKELETLAKRSKEERASFLEQLEKALADNDKLRKQIADLEKRLAEKEKSSNPEAKDEASKANPPPGHVKAEIIQVLDQNMVRLKVGTAHGVAVGHTFEVYGGMGRIRIVKADPDHSLANRISGTGKFLPGCTVENTMVPLAILADEADLIVSGKVTEVKDGVAVVGVADVLKPRSTKLKEVQVKGAGDLGQEGVWLLTRYPEKDVYCVERCFREVKKQKELADLVVAREKLPEGKVVNGLIARAEVIEQKTASGLAYEVRLSVKNVSDKTITICDFPNHYPVQIQWTGPDGNPREHSDHYAWLDGLRELSGRRNYLPQLSSYNYRLPVPPGAIRFIGIHEQILVPPFWGIGARNSGIWFKAPEVGKHRISVSFTNKEQGKEFGLKNVWQGTVVANEISFTVK